MSLPGPSSHWRAPQGRTGVKAAGQPQVRMSGASGRPEGQHRAEPTTPLLPQERPKPRVPILHFRAARPPFVICVKLVSVSRGWAPLMTAWLEQGPSCGIKTSDTWPGIQALGLGHLSGAVVSGRGW